MRSASIPFFTDPDRAPDRRRALAMILTLIAHALLLLMLLWLAPNVTKLPSVVNKLITFNVPPEMKSDKPEKSVSSSAGANHHSTSVPQPVAQPKPPIVLPSAPWVLTPGLEKFDVKQVPVTKPAEPTQTEADNSEGDSTYTEGPGHGSYGPNADGSTGGGSRDRFYNVEWYREPTDAELSTYLPKENVQSGSADIVCRTIEHYHVDNCRELGESPVGTGLARTLRLASWQFLIRPPHVGGKSLIGSLVRIHYTLTVRDNGPAWRRH